MITSEILNIQILKKTKEKIQFLAYALKSDDGNQTNIQILKKTRRKIQFPAYALKSDDGDQTIQPAPYGDHGEIEL